ncbi:(2Fe-2S)-binding protein [Funiculus sociatus GB2-A5]|uniref:(2Fe-2S)-binding protein n=1 Tax=Funiculus sociatus GB2-A5 TaxID=2933946 RepID=A0ABV0JSZ6_9CYAN|nr:(2Fe-2S)-binding protein [Trichocoleus sp. FACHB-832]MBD2060794.1 (2Fe-2S)-binding protein [Trichocoleus sp. FACHB-6]
MNSIKFVNEDKEVIVMDGTNLRLKAIESSVDIYKGMTKLLNCRGNGKCGNCMVEVVAGSENLSPRTPVEEQKLKKKPANYRLACQSLVNGNVAVKTKP